jgi:hypothetical protein
MAKKKPIADKKLRQKHLPGMKPKSNPKLDKWAEHYEDAKADAARAASRKDDCESNLRFEMKKAKLTMYKTPSGITVIYSSKEKVTTKKDSTVKV